MPNTSVYIELKEICEAHHATLVVVSKTRTEKEVLAIHQLGQRIFAENRVQDLIIKAELLPTDIEWHLIGHLQTNKIKPLMPYVHCIQSLDSWKLWQKLDEEAKEAHRTIKCLLQIKVAKEDTKQGWEIDQLNNVLSSGLYLAFDNIEICGVMGMASLTADKEQIHQEMKKLKAYFDQIRLDHYKNDNRFNVLSMGMSGDYSVALKEGSNMIRVGSLIFE